MEKRGEKRRKERNICSTTNDKQGKRRGKRPENQGRSFFGLFSAFGSPPGRRLRPESNNGPFFGVPKLSISSKRKQAILLIIYIFFNRACAWHVHINANTTRATALLQDRHTKTADLSFNFSPKCCNRTTRGFQLKTPRVRYEPVVWQLPGKKYDRVNFRGKKN